MNTKNVQKSIIPNNFPEETSPYSIEIPFVKKNILGIDVTDAKTGEVLEYILKIIRKTTKNIYVVTPNPEILLSAIASKQLQLAINGADLALCDGMQLFRAAQVLGQPLKERIIGTDLMEKLCEKVEDWPITVGFMGSRPGVAAKTAECLAGKFPKLKISYIGQEWSREGFAYAQNEISNKNQAESILHNSKFIVPQQIDILFVAFGAPKQELWMAEHINKLPVRVMIGVGGAFDQIVDPSLRPPQLVHQLGLGWLYRLIRQPSRITRQARLVKFVGLVLSQKVRQSFHG